MHDLSWQSKFVAIWPEPETMELVKTIAPELELIFDEILNGNTNGCGLPEAHALAKANAIAHALTSGVDLIDIGKYALNLEVVHEILVEHARAYRLKVDDEGCL
jgi:hypothetical protein